MSTAAPAKAAKPAKCPQCGKPAVADYAPFCSRRCADVDLARWLRGDYAIPSAEPVLDADEEDGEA